MKIKSNVNVWEHFENLLLNGKKQHYFHYGSDALDGVIELETTDFLKCIAICKQFKKYPLKKEVELEFENFNCGRSPSCPSHYLGNFKNSVSNQRKYTNTSDEIRRVVNETFAKEFDLLNNLNKLAELHSRFNCIEEGYFRIKEDYETAVNQLETFRKLKNGLSPEEFSWEVLEPAKQQEE